MRSSAQATNSAAQKSGSARKSERVDMRTSSHGLSPGPKWRPSLSEAQEKKRRANVRGVPEARNRGDPHRRTLKRNSDAMNFEARGGAAGPPASPSPTYRARSN